MDFELSAEQAMLKDSVERFIQDNYAFSQWQALAGSDLGYSANNWKTFAEMGWLMLPFAEENGGLGGSVVDVAVVTEALGAGMTLEPLMSSVLLGGKLVEYLGDEIQKEAILGAVAEGTKTLALAYGEPAARFDLSFAETRARKSEAGYVLIGRKSVVLHAASADGLIVIARTAGEADDVAGISAFLVEPDAPGLRCQDYPLVDGGRASDVFLADTPAELLGEEGTALAALQRVIDEATCAVCAEAVGAMGWVLEVTKDYTATRNQFGKAIGDNQVIQHRLVDMFTAVEEAKAITDMTVMRVAEGAENASAQVSAMKAKVGEAARFVGAQGVQLHGGIGMTDEYPIGHYFKRLMALDVMFGDTAHHLNRFAETV
ncbi:acyl-CoA dehydrogenase family protein [uncultured Shimia sp.]|uniref:acyl-CoA dehydrogenase family protein n=1 Tax=uncultured Shimia sp. TaxID=573152 RepID=UPI0025EBC7CF|nr:acyl-CoA dehydrogenase family protein [uncultured Shimia sp.]